MANYTKGSGRRPQEETYRIFHNALREGMTVMEALKVAGRSRSWYEERRRKDPEFAEFTDHLRERLADPEKYAKAVPDFPEFCEEYLGIKLWPHQLRMVDVLEGREPRDLHPSIKYFAGASGNRRILANWPPNHAKTMTVTISYVTWRLLKNPNMSILLVSKTATFASKLLYAIRQRLTHPSYLKLQQDFGPPEGFKASADSWTANSIYLGKQDDLGQKDPQVSCVGLGGQIYGSRAQLIIVDDAVTLANAHQWESQMDWLRQEVATRLGPDDQLVVVGTRVAPVDLYRELMNPAHYGDEVVPWTYLGQPAVLEYAEDVNQWKTLWPIADQPFSEADVPDDSGIYQRWTGPRLNKIRNEVGPKKWSSVYQQMDVEEESIFDPVCVKGSVDARRNIGVLVPGMHDVPEVTTSLYTICAMDPAVKGNTAAVAYSVDRRTGRRWLLDAEFVTAPTPKQIRELIEKFTERYTPHEWVIEANAFQLSLVQDEHINAYLAARGVIMKPHYTHSHNKKDAEYGVASMSVLFGTAEKAAGKAAVHAGDNLLSLPQPSVPGVKKLIDELVSWSPEVPVRNRQQDLLMATWFAELRAREVVQTASRRNYFSKSSTFLSERDKGRQYIVNLDDLAAEQSSKSFL